MLPQIDSGYSSSVLQQWEQAGKSLADALSSYLKSCLSLETFSPAHCLRTKDLALNIDDSLETLHVKLSYDLAQSRNILVRMRNSALSRIHSLPNEILSNIFLEVVYSPSSGPYRHNPMAKTLRAMFKNLQYLLSVCSAWRGIALAHDKLWLVVPAGDNESLNGIRNTAALALSRSPALPSQDRQLYLAAILSPDEDSDANFPFARSQAPPFSIINIESTSDHKTSVLLENLLQSQSPTILSQLSIHQIRPKMDPAHPRRHLPRESFTHYMSNENHDALLVLINSLSVLRIKGVNINWDQVDFSNKLVEFKLQSVVLDEPSKLTGVLKSLESAPALQNLSFISIIVFNLDEASGAAPAIFSFPKLRSLLLEDLDFEALRILLCSITPGSYRLRLSLTSRCFLSYVPGDEPDDDEAHIQTICEILETTLVDTLVIVGDRDWYDFTWLHATELREILQSLPDLRTLKMAFWTFDEEVLLSLERPHSPTGDISPIPFPTLETLCIISGVVHDTGDLQRVVTSHSLQEMELSGHIGTESFDDALNSKIFNCAPIGENSRIARWLRDTVPVFYLSLERVEDYSQEIWQLW